MALKLGTADSCEGIVGTALSTTILARKAARVKISMSNSFASQIGTRYIMDGRHVLLCFVIDEIA